MVSSMSCCSRLVPLRFLSNLSSKQNISLRFKCSMYNFFSRLIEFVTWFLFTLYRSHIFFDLWLWLVNLHRQNLRFYKFGFSFYDLWHKKLIQITELIHHRVYIVFPKNVITGDIRKTFCYVWRTQFWIIIIICHIDLFRMFSNFVISIGKEIDCYHDWLIIDGHWLMPTLW